MSPKPIVVYGHGPTPNPWKVILILEELGLPYEQKTRSFQAIKEEPYLSINPNGRLPAIEDPNTGITLWESGAILEYLIETYDKEQNISFEHNSKDYFLAKQWLHFQVSGQGPYFGQAGWFILFHSEKLQSAIDRYINEIRRVSGVLDRVLKEREYLVGGKFSYVDAAFIPWFDTVPKFTGDAVNYEKDFPYLNAWLSRLHSRPKIAKVVKEREEIAAATQRQS